MLILKVKEKYGYKNIVINNISGVTNIYRKTSEYPPFVKEDLEEPDTISGRYVKVFVGETEITKVFCEFNRENAMDILRRTEKKMDDIVDVLCKCLCCGSVANTKRINLTSDNNTNAYTHMRGYLTEATAEDNPDIMITIERDQITHINYGNLRKVLSKDDFNNMLDNHDKL